MIVLLRYRQPRHDDHPDVAASSVEVDSIHADDASVASRLAQVEQSNKPYKMEPLGLKSWRIGPPDDGSIFTQRPMIFATVTPKHQANRWVPA